MIGAVPILRWGQIKETRKESKRGKKRSKDHETEFALYRYGAAYFIGLSDRICLQQTPPGFEIKSSHPAGETTCY